MALAIIAAVLLAIAAVIVSFRSTFSEVERLVKVQNHRQDMDAWGERYNEKHLNRRYRILAEIKMEKRMRQLMEKVTHKKYDKPEFDPEMLCDVCGINYGNSPYGTKTCRECWPAGYTSKTEAA